MSEHSKFCTKCGAPLADGQRVCGSCGEPTGVSPEGASRSEILQPGQPAAAKIAFGGFWIRFAAYLIDSLALSPVVAILILRPLIARGTAIPDNPLDFLQGSSQQILATKLLITMVSWLYFASMESSAWQATLGKRMLGLRVVDLQGRRISFARASGRYFGKIISGMILMLGFVMAGFTARKQGLHDILASTLVLRGRTTSNV